MPLLQSLTLRPDHQTKSSRVAGWRLWKYLRVKFIRASSLSVLPGCGPTLFDARAYVAFMGRRSPLQRVPVNSAIRMW